MPSLDPGIEIHFDPIVDDIQSSEKLNFRLSYSTHYNSW